MAKKEVAQLTLSQLDFAVGLALGWELPIESSINRGKIFYTEKDKAPLGGRICIDRWKPTINWTQGGPLLEEKHVAVRHHSAGKWYAMLSSDLGDFENAQWAKSKYIESDMAYVKTNCLSTGASILEAGMRCIVVAALGNLIELSNHD